MTAAANVSLVDQFVALGHAYLGFRTEEAKAEQTGQAQMQHANTVETTTGQNQGTENGTGEGFQLTNQHLLIGGVAVLGLILVLKK